MQCIFREAPRSKQVLSAHFPIYTDDLCIIAGFPQQRTSVGYIELAEKNVQNPARKTEIFDSFSVLLRRIHPSKLQLN